MGFSTKILLLLKHGPCTSDEIQEQLGVSQSVVSRELRELIEDKYVKKYNSNTPLYYKNNVPMFAFRMFRLLVGLCGAERETLAVVRDFTLG